MSFLPTNYTSVPEYLDDSVILDSKTVVFDFVFVWEFILYFHTSTPRIETFSLLSKNSVLSNKIVLSISTSNNLVSLSVLLIILYFTKNANIAELLPTAGLISTTMTSFAVTWTSGDVLVNRERFRLFLLNCITLWLSLIVELVLHGLIAEIFWEFITDKLKLLFMVCAIDIEFTEVATVFEKFFGMLFNVVVELWTVNCDMRSVGDVRIFTTETTEFFTELTIHL